MPCQAGGIPLKRCTALPLRFGQGQRLDVTTGNAKTLGRILREAGASGMGRREFTRRTQFMDHRQRDGGLQTLAEAGQIEVEIRHGVGRLGQWLKVL